MQYIDTLQDKLEFAGWQSDSFNHKHGLGRIGLTGFLLGTTLGLHLCLLLMALLVDPSALPFGGKDNNHTLIQWSLYMVALSGFHFGEFLNTALFKADVVNYDSFVVNHSKSYTIAALASWTEFWLEAWFKPFGLPKFRALFFVAGMLLVAAGQILRALAMYTCGPNFAHQIMERRANGHRLVTHGVYSKLRHPSYTGWFWWCVGTQLLLCNPLCVCAYALAAWDFFRHRIPYEEALLAKFYPNEYPKYVARTYVGIPFVPVTPFPVGGGAGGGGGGGSPVGSGSGGGGDDDGDGARERLLRREDHD
jgi:protein-S-isoprenylcysteine O-methyltransferase